MSIFDRSPRLTVVSFETVDRCNRACWFCKFGQYKQDAKAEFLPTPLLEKACRELGAARFGGRISLYGINEPLMDRRIYDLCEIARTHAPLARVTVLTNGDLLTPQACERFAALGVVVGVSVYDDRTQGKMESLLSAGHSVRLIDRRDEGFVANRAGHVAELTVIDRPTKYQRANGVTELPVVGANPMVGRNCLRPSSLLQFVPSGRAVLCCCDFNGDVCVGDLNAQTVEQIWYGEPLEGIRRRLTAGRKGMTLCERCDHNGDPHGVQFP